MTIRPLLLTLAVYSAMPLAASGQGFGIYEQGACAMARGGAAVASPCDDGSAIYVNPAGLTGNRGWLVSGGVLPVFGSSAFSSDTGVTTESQRRGGVPPGHAYFRYGINERWAVGVGAYVPYGLGTKWPLDFAGRFVSFDSRLTTTYLQPSAAYKWGDNLSIGAGLAIARGSVTLKRREDLSRVPIGVGALTFATLLDVRTDFAETTLSASGASGVAGHFGLLWHASDRVSLGGRYLMPVSLKYDGDAQFTPTGGGFVVTKANPLGLAPGTPLDIAPVLAALPDQRARTELKMPAQFSVGGSYRIPTLALKLLLEYQWVGWSVFETVTLDFSELVTPDEVLVQNYRDTSAIRIGAEVEASPRLRLRGGYYQNQAAAPDENVTPLLPEAARKHVTGGIGWNWGPRLTLDVAYQFIAHADRAGRVVNPPAGVAPTTALNSGIYRARGDLFGITFTYRP